MSRSCCLEKPALIFIFIGEGQVLKELIAALFVLI